MPATLARSAAAQAQQRMAAWEEARRVARRARACRWRAGLAHVLRCTVQHSTVQHSTVQHSLAHVLQHSTVSQLRVKCLEALLALLEAAADDAAATAVLAATAAPGASGAAGSALVPALDACPAQVSAQDPSAAHKALAGAAAAALLRAAWATREPRGAGNA
ncbi:hypothetical protein HT031_002762 [Scenedesmus sp. PABB004]|nr:hypothetical protein HT031_002762 [Scenedesmus sp. PABB004]